MRGIEFESIFDPISRDELTATPRKDAINHDQAFLRSSAMSTAEIITCVNPAARDAASFDSSDPASRSRDGHCALVQDSRKIVVANRVGVKPAVA